MSRPLTVASVLFAALLVAVPVQADPVEVVEDCLYQDCGADIDDFVCISSPGPYGVSSPYGCIGPCDDSLETYNTGHGCEPLPDAGEYGEVGTCDNGGNLPVGVYVRIESFWEFCADHATTDWVFVVEPCPGGTRVKVATTVYDECHQDPEPSAGLCNPYYGEGGVFVDSGVQVGNIHLSVCVSSNVPPCVYWHEDRYDDGSPKPVVSAACL